MAASPRYDIGLDADDDIPLRIQIVTGIDLIIQRITSRLKFFKGEYFADRRPGLPFFEWARQKPPRVAEIGALIRREIEGCPGVIRVEDFEGTWDADLATLTFSGTVLTTDGIASLEIVPLGRPAGNRSPFARLVITGGSIAP